MTLKSICAGAAQLLKAMGFDTQYVVNGVIQRLEKTMKNYKTKTNKADCCQFFIAQTTHCNTHVLYIWRRHRTHTHTHTQVSLRSR